ncbi:MAG: hypothetical protein GC191_11340 [Azospirillum sp.]|nr:hypothetical protein [Azospirillum sp.]
MAGPVSPPAPAPQRPGPPGWLGLRPVAVVELALFFGLAFALDVLWLDGQRFAGIEPHPFWAPVLLLAVQYGTGAGVVAALAATAALRIGNLPEPTLSQDLYQYLFQVSFLPLLWLVSAVLLGELRLRHLGEREQLRAALDDARREAAAITQSYQQLKQVKDSLEARVAGQIRTVFTLYEAARAIDKLDEGEVMLGVADLVRSVMKPDKFSLFLLNNDILESVTSEGWDEEDSYARWFGAGSTLFEAVIGRQRQLCVAQVEDERILRGEGLLAGPLVSSDTGEVVGMVKIEQLAFMDLNLATIENFRILCQWVGTALAQARAFQRANQTSLVNEEGLYTSYFFSRQARFLARLGERLGFETSTIVIRPTNLARYSSDQRREVAAVIGAAVRETLRDTDLAFDYGHQGQSVGVVLPATGLDRAQVVAGKLEAAVRGKLPAGMEDLAIEFAAEHVAGDA